MVDKNPRLTVDVLVTDESGERVLLIKRKNEPFQDKWALPGGFVEYGETIEVAAAREVKEELNVEVELEGLLGVYSDPGRDPRGHTISIVFFGKKKKGKEKAGSDAADLMWALFDKTDMIDFAFDHANIVADYRIIMMGSVEK